MKPIKLLTLAICLFAGIVALLVPAECYHIEGLSVVEQRVIAIFIFAALMWITETVPIWTTSVLIIVILLMMILRPGMMTIIIAYSLVGWIPMARLVRGQVVALKQQEYIAAAEAMGAGPARIIARHLLPNTLSVVIVRVTLSIPSAIFSEAYLSYIGLGIPLPMCSWGSLAQLGIENFRIYPYQLIIPAICISLTMLAFNMFGDGLRDAFDPRLRR